MTGTLTWPTHGWIFTPPPASLAGGETVSKATGPQGTNLGPMGVVGSIVLAVLGPKIFDHYVTQPLVEKEILSPRSAPFFTASALLGSLRLFGAGAVGTALKKMPQFTAIKKIVDSVYDAIGLPRSETISLGLDALSVSPFAIAYAYPQSFAARALTSGAGGVLSGVGGVLLIDQLSEPVLSGGAHLYFDMASELPGLDATLWDLSVASVQETVSEELPLGAYLPNIASASYGLVSFWDQYVWTLEGTKFNDIQAKIDARFDAKMEALRAGAESVGQALNGNLVALLATNLSLAGGELKIDWDGFRRSVLAFYRANSEKIHQAYQLPYDILPGDAATLVQLIDQEGFITDLDAMKSYLLGLYAPMLREKIRELEARAFDARLELTEGKDGLKPAEDPRTMTALDESASCSETPDTPEELFANQTAFLEGAGKSLVSAIRSLKRVTEALEEK